MKKELEIITGWTACDHCGKHTNKVFVFADDGTISKQYSFRGARGEIQICSTCNKKLNKGV